MRCERETALLRAEILDLEDKYYALKSHYESGAIGTSVNSGVLTGGVIGSGVIQGSPVVVGSVPMGIEGYPVNGDVIYDDQIISGSVVPGTVMPGTVIPTPAMGYQGEVYYEGGAIPVDQTTVDSSIESNSIPAGSQPGGLNLETPPVDEATSENEQTLLLPDSPKLEVGFEELELELSSDTDIDRIEIVTDATHGIDLDGVPGHDGIELMIRTLNSDGEFIEQSGELTVTVKDQLAGEIGKWTFLPKELELFLSRDEFGNMGTLLHLPWTDRIPVSKQVEVRVAMMVGNVEYIATRKIDVDPPTGQRPGGAIVGWATEDNRWVSSGPTRQVQTDRLQTNRQLPSTSVYDKPSTAIQRPVWKPVR